MKKKIIMLLTISVFAISGCSTNTVESQKTTEIEEEPQETNSIDDTAQEPDDLIVDIPDSESENNDTKDNASDSTINSEIDSEDTSITCTELFESIYMPYANREKSFTFNDVKAFMQSTDYDLEIVEPTADDLGTIKTSDDNNDYVYFAFNAVNGTETIMSVSYYQDSTNSEVSLSNYSTDGSSKYDSFSIHVIGEPEKEVAGPDEQKEFLFD